jgi:hypothetical protein
MPVARAIPIPMHRTLLLFAAALLGAAAAFAPAAAASDDPLQAPECRQALAALHDQEAAAASAPTPMRAERRDSRSLDPKLDAARRRAARSCLASRADPPVPGRLAQPPLVVPPVVGVRPPLSAASSTPIAIPTRPPGPPPLTSITSCDSGGCWASDGSRLNRVGPTLWGPHGACSVQGSVVQCP